MEGASLLPAAIERKVNESAVIKYNLVKDFGLSKAAPSLTS